ncbi:MAG: hypothetical protein V7642_1574, partial [Burkholderiales bacterium]
MTLKEFDSSLLRVDVAVPAC